MKISKTRERIKNLILFHSDEQNVECPHCHKTFTRKRFDSKNKDDVALASQIAANATIAMSDWIDYLSDEITDEQIKIKVKEIVEKLKKDANWWNPNPDILDAVPIE